MSNITVTVKKNQLKEIDAFLVRGIGKRAIVVAVRHFPAVVYPISKEEIAIHAAKHAAANGWKKVFVEPDEMCGEYAECFNAQSFTNHCINFCNLDDNVSRPVKFSTICYVGECEITYTSLKSNRSSSYDYFL